MSVHLEMNWLKEIDRELEFGWCICLKVKHGCE